MASWVPALAVAVALLSGCGSDGGEEASRTSPLRDPAATEAAPEAEAVPGSEGGELTESDRVAVESAFDGYVAAINARDGEALCGLLAPGALAGIELPLQRPRCGQALSASIGYRRPGGTPAWRRTRVHQVRMVQVGAGRARVTATVSHDFADRPEPSIEEDVVYLDRVGGEWLIAKPSATLYRAVGYPEPPLRALKPPAG